MAFAVLQTVVASQRRTFATRDVSEDQRMTLAHAALRAHPNYHAFVGRALSVHRDELGLSELRKGTSRGDLAAARALVASMVPESVAEVTRVDLEWAPIPADEYLGDRTAFDAAIEYVTPDGALCLLGIETKLTEPFSPGEYKRESYERWTAGPRSPLRPEARATLYRSETNQLWRDHLLAVALRDHPRSDLSVARLMVVHHPLDRDCRRVLDRYQDTLLPDHDSLRILPLDRLLAGWRPHVHTDDGRAWLDALTLRYLSLERSGS